MKEAREINAEANNLKSRLMPGALHNIGSSFISIWYKHDYSFSIILETCTDTGFEYSEFYSHAEEPGFFGNMGGSDMYSCYQLPQRNQDSETLSDYFSKLSKDEFGVIFIGEVNSSEIKAFLNRNIELIGSKVCPFDEAIFGITKIGVKSPRTWKNKHLQDEFKKWNCLFSEKFNLGLKQITAGAVVEGNNNTWDLRGNEGTGLAGNGCLKSLITSFENSQNFENLSGITINITGNNFNENILLEAIVSGKIPSMINFKGVSPEFNFYNNFYTFTQWLKVFAEHQFPSDLVISIFDLATKILQQEAVKISSIVDLGKKMVTTKNPEFNLLKYDFFANPSDLKENKSLGFDQKSQASLTKKISNLVSQKLSQSFIYKDQNWVLISPTLEKNIQQELTIILGDALSKLCPTQINILLKIIRGGIPGRSLNNFVGKFNIINKSFNVVSGAGLNVSGLTGIYYDCISCDMFALGTGTFGFFKSEETKSASHDDLKQSFSERKSKSSALMYNLIAKAATPERIVSTPCKL